MVLKTDDENDSKLIYYINENNEDAKDLIYSKYSGLIHKEINRVKNIAYSLNIDMADLSQEAMLAFSNAINSYDADEEVKFITFATLCIRRRLSNYIKKHTTQKMNIEKSAIPLELINDVTSESLIDSISDSKSKDPLHKLILNETLDETEKKVFEVLSDKERAAFLYDLEGKSISEISTLMRLTNKQIYNLLHRARKKIKSRE